jgi:hypothetical protein
MSEVKKAKKPPALDIKREMVALDGKRRDFYDGLTDAELKEFSGYMMIRWGATVQGGADLQAYYVMSCNEKLNKHFFDVSAKEHEKLHWLLATTVSPGMGNQYHPWLGLPKKTTGNKTINFLRKLYPHLKEDDIKLLADINGTDDLKRMARELGWDDKRIKSDL